MIYFAAHRSLLFLRYAHKGFSLIETAIVLGIVGLVIGGIWVAAAIVIKNQQIAALQAATLKVITDTQRAFQGFTPNDISTRSVGSLDTKIMYTLHLAGVFSPDVFPTCVTSATLNAQNYCANAWGAPGLFLSARKSATDVGDYVMQQGVGSAEVCIKLIMSFGAVDFASAGILAVGTGFREYTDSSQISLSQVRSDCTLLPLMMLRFGP